MGQGSVVDSVCTPLLTRALGPMLSYCPKVGENCRLRFDAASLSANFSDPRSQYCRNIREHGGP